MRSAILLLLLALAGTAQAAGSHPEPPKIEDALAQAARAHRPLVLEFYTEWCHPCQDMDAHVFPDPRVKRALAPAILVRYDAEKGNGLEAAKRYKVTGYPLILVLDPGGHIVDRHDGGGPDAEYFAHYFEEALVLAFDDASIKALEADSSAGASRHLVAARWFLAQKRLPDAQAAYDRAIKADPDNKEGVVADATLEVAFLDKGAERRKHIVVAATTIIEKWPDAGSADVALRLAVVPAEADKGKIARLLAARRQALQGDAVGLNGFIYVAVTAHACDEAIAAGERLLALTPDDPNVYDSAAEAYHCKGQKAKAVATLKKGIAKAPDDKKDFYGENLPRFQSGKGEPADCERMRGQVNDLLDGKAASDEPAAPPTFDPQQDPFARALGEAVTATGKACASAAGPITKLKVRVSLLPAGQSGPPSKLVFLEAGIPHALQKCVLEHLGKAPLPDGGALAGTSTTLIINLSPAR